MFENLRTKKRALYALLNLDTPRNCAPPNPNTVLLDFCSENDYYFSHTVYQFRNNGRQPLRSVICGVLNTK